MADDVTSVLTLKLPEGATWSDGTPFIAQDVVGTWDILWMNKSGNWNSP